MTTPQRIQVRRTKGYRKPDGAVYVGRPSKWGNPFTVAGARDAEYQGTEAELRDFCVSLFRRWLKFPYSEWAHGADKAEWIMLHVDYLRGKDLACWCPLDQPCHADVLLELANR